MTNSYHEQVPNDAEFELERDAWRSSLGADEKLRSEAVTLLRLADKHHFGYQWVWCGVPIIRLPDDIVVLQEIIWSVRPRTVIETGIARGGSVVLSASLMAMAGIEPRVLGIDNLVHQHTRDAIAGSPFGDSITIWQGDSSGEESAAEVADFLRAYGEERPALLVLDSDHTHTHVLSELKRLAPLLPPGSLVLVADTIIEEMPDDYYPERPWGPGNSPASAVRQFLEEDQRFVLDERWCRRGLISEFRDGVLRRERG